MRRRTNTKNRRTRRQIEIDREKVLDDIRANPGTDIRQIIARLGINPKHVTHDLMTLRIEYKVIAKRDGYKAITYTSMESSDTRALDAYLLRHIAHLPEAAMLRGVFGDV